MREGNNILQITQQIKSGSSTGSNLGFISAKNAFPPGLIWRQYISANASYNFVAIFLRFAIPF